MAQNWLTAVAVGAHLPNAGQLAIAGQTATPEAWSTVRRVCQLTDETLSFAVATKYRVNVADLAAADGRSTRLVPESLARKYMVLPVGENDREIMVATANPVNADAERDLAFASGRRPVFEIAAPAAILRRIGELYRPASAVEALLSAVSEQIADVEVVEDNAPSKIGADEIEAAPIVRLTNIIIQDAVAAGASDVHIEPGLAASVVRFRVDGVLRQHLQMPPAASVRVVSRIKVMAKLDIADRLRPQDGRTRVRVRDKTYDLRISTVPTRDVEKMVIRILEPERKLSLEDLGMSAPERERLRRLLEFREGIVIVTGPTGSGKTTTMYSCIQELTTGKINITTVEDPVEYQMAGITQIQVDPHRGVTFPSALRAVLRQDPDVLFVGEIRDLETAEVAVQASVTGHLVLATLHTNDAAGVVQRLVDLGLNRPGIAGSLRGAMAQRLVRLVCTTCAVKATEPLNITESRLAQRFNTQPTVRAVGCPTCFGIGYRGRVAVSEVLVATPELLEIVAKSGTAAELQAAAEAGGMRPIRESALDHVREGRTTLEELDRILGESQGEPAKAVASTLPHILLVDDDPLVRAVARATLEQNHFAVTEVSDGTVALERLAVANDFALMVLDLKMPGMGGMDVLRKLRSAVQTAGLPVVVLTGSDDASSEVAVMEAGADDYIRKPLDPPRFLARIKAAMRRASAAPQLST
jgi:type II secretory ATPase GspE/PulE/Tfp pilus assembly ATPase PilB-like protein/ActR/RegA family two-component response regulator